MPGVKFIGLYILCMSSVGVKCIGLYICMSSVGVKCIGLYICRNAVGVKFIRFVYIQEPRG